MADPSIRRARRVTIVLTVVVLTLGAAACGSAKGAASTSASTGANATGTGATGSGASGTAQQDLEAYRTCLQEHGVANGGGFGGRGARASGAGGDGQVAPAPNASTTSADDTPRTTVDQATLTAAQTACDGLRPAAGSGANGGFGASGASGAGAQQFSAYLSCLSDNGVVTSSVAPGASGTTGAPGQRGGPGSIDRSTPAFTAANDKCKVLLPDGVDPFAGGGARGGPPGAVPTTTAAN